MKRKTIIQLTAALAAVGLVMICVDKNTSKVAFAAFEGVEGSSEFIDTAEYAEEQAAAPVVLETENVISSEEMEAPLEEKRLCQAQKIFQKKVQSKQRLHR